MTNAVHMWTSITCGSIARLLIYIEGESGTDTSINLKNILQNNKYKGSENYIKKDKYYKCSIPPPPILV